MPPIDLLRIVFFGLVVGLWLGPAQAARHERQNARMAERARSGAKGRKPWLDWHITPEQELRGRAWWERQRAQRAQRLERKTIRKGL